jgi:LuxR family maltose regulon positive regulatory protein
MESPRSWLPRRLGPPAGRPDQVARERIVERMLAAGPARLVLVCAPAGFGKTTAMQQAHARSQADGIATAWLTLDRADNDLPRFLGGLLAALAQVGLPPRVDGQSVDLAAALARNGRPFALFLDDFESIQQDEVLALVRDLLEHLPPGGRLVIGSRSLPELGLGRLRARGQLLEIDAELLRFSSDETAAFFRLHGDCLPPDAVQRLHDKAEGWVAALGLVALALKRHDADSDFVARFVARFSGTDRAVADYLAEDVLARQPQEVRDFLLRTSVLRHLDAAVCQALLPRVDCGRMLRRVEAANLFLQPVEARDGSYRYHPLFAGFLRAQLARECPDDVARLHLAASGWYEAQGQPVPAIDHAIEGGDHPHAMHLLQQHAETFLDQGRMRLLDRWFTALQPRLHERPRLQAAAIWAELFTHGPWPAMRRLEESGCEASTDAVVAAHVNALRPMLLLMVDRLQEALAAGRAGLARLPTARPFADGVLLNVMADIAVMNGDGHEVQRLMDAGGRRRADGMFHRMGGESLAGVLDLNAGRLRQATARFRLAVGATPHGVSYAYTNGNAWAGVLYAGALYEADALSAAERLLNVYLPPARDVGLPDHMIVGHRMRARIAFDGGDADLAFQALEELEDAGHRRQLPRVVAGAHLERARVMVLQGDGHAARDALRRADEPGLWEQVQRLHLPAHELEDLQLGEWRVQIHFCDPGAAVPAMTQALHGAVAAGRQYRAMKLRVLLALAHWRLGDAAAADDTLLELLPWAAREGFVRVVLDEGPAVAPLLARAHQALGSAEPGEESASAGHLQRLLDRLGPAAGPAAAAAAPELPAERLTPKEIRVLRLLAEGYSNSAMAQKLFVSDSTVRTHLRNINTKLGVRSRMQAVASARRLGMIR